MKEPKNGNFLMKFSRQDKNRFTKIDIMDKFKFFIICATNVATI